MPPKSHSTVQGQAWDQIAKSRLGSEFQMHKLLEQNWQSRAVLLFSGDKTVSLPENAAPTAKSPTQSVPPWKR
ncbi:hypothetical protein LJC15_00180 [Desulfovibrio sp. OttesenSCG-928-G11]|nr:hypothetical protein [Desulfovibrio sp. OttesenSCG-928-G11]